MIILKYKNFLNESKNQKDDFSEVLSILIDLPNKEILNFRNDLKKMVESTNINENIFTDYFKNLQAQSRKWFTQKLFKFLIDRKRDYYVKLIDKLSIFDIKNLDDVYKAFPAFKLESLYLAGGMDAAKKGGKLGWRNNVEYQFEFGHPGSKKLTPEIEIHLGEDGEDIKKVKPSYVVDGLMLDLFINDPKKCAKFYNKPMLLNPVRKEVDRNKIDFDKYLTAIKKAGVPQNEVEEAVEFFRRVMGKHIVYDDELLINNISGIFLGLNKFGGAGTYGELELLSFMEKPLFCCLVEGYEGIVGNFKLWNMPQLCKLARNAEETKILTETLYKYAQK